MSDDIEHACADPANLVDRGEFDNPEEFDAWIKLQSPVVQEAAAKVQPYNLYRLGQTIVWINGYCLDGTVSVAVSREFNFILSQTLMQGVPPEQLEIIAGWDQFDDYRLMLTDETLAKISFAEHTFQEELRKWVKDPVYDEMSQDDRETAIAERCREWQRGVMRGIFEGMTAPEQERVRKAVALRTFPPEPGKTS